MDKKAAGMLQNILTAQGYEVISVDISEENFIDIADISPHIIILDPYFSSRDGNSFIKSLRKVSDCPIIAISSATAEKAKIDALDAGADDYVEKPVPIKELLARIRVIIRRIEREEAKSGILLEKEYKSRGLTVDFNRMSVTVNGRKIHLTKNEFKILALLCRYPYRVLSYKFIMKSVWGPHITEGTGILRVNITNIRRKIGGGYIETENGTGYRIV